MYTLIEVIEFKFKSSYQNFQNLSLFVIDSKSYTLLSYLRLVCVSV